MTPGRYVTEAGSVVVVDGVHGLYDIDLDYAAEGACPGSECWLEDSGPPSWLDHGDPPRLHWSCDCCPCGAGSAVLRREP